MLYVSFLYLWHWPFSSNSECIFSYHLCIPSSICIAFTESSHVILSLSETTRLKHSAVIRMLTGWWGRENIKVYGFTKSTKGGDCIGTEDRHCSGWREKGLRRILKDAHSLTGEKSGEATSWDGENWLSREMRSRYLLLEGYFGSSTYIWFWEKDRKILLDGRE
jgi:hypothetical protein